MRRPPSKQQVKAKRGVANPNIGCMCQVDLPTISQQIIMCLHDGAWSRTWQVKLWTTNFCQVWAECSMGGDVSSILMQEQHSDLPNVMICYRASQSDLNMPGFSHILRLNTEPAKDSGAAQLVVVAAALSCCQQAV